VWLGEIEIARNQEPERALEQFRLAQRLVCPSDPAYGCAAYDRAFTLLRRGAYTQATQAFLDLMRSKTVLNGYSRNDCRLLYRHAVACAGYHAQHAKLGITEPPSLDPLCGVASLAACLRANGRPYDRKTLLAHCRVTGLGNSLQDLLVGAKRLGLTGAIVKTDDKGLIALPKPLVAYVEQDHFVALTRADQDGVSYLCSDCGAWPGGRRDLTWKQWRAMDCAIYLVVTQPGSPTDRALRILRNRSVTQPVAVRASRARLAASRSGNAIAGPVWATRLLGTHTVLWDQGGTSLCTMTITSPQCPPDQCNCPTDSGSSGSGGGGPPTDAHGPSSGDPVDLATGEEEYQPEPDLTVYNPIGPPVVWQRHYGSLRGPTRFIGFGYNWNTEYDLQASVSGTQITLNLSNGATYQFVAASVPTASFPQISCPAAVGGTPMLCVWNYNGDGSLSLVFTRRDRTQWVFSSLNGYLLSRIVDRNNNDITFAYSGSSSLLTRIDDQNGRPLLTIRRDANSNIVSVADRYGRSVLYQVKRFWNRHAPPSMPAYYDGLAQVSQVVRTGSLAPAFRYRLGYKYTAGDDYSTLVLGSITVPSPTGRGVSTATLNYDQYGYIASIKDGNGNTRTYTSPGNTTTVTITDPAGNVVTSYTVTYDTQMRLTGRTDGTNQTLVYQASYAGNSGPTIGPTQETDGNNNVTTYTYDQYGQVLTKTSPRNVTTTYARVYGTLPTDFPLGELTQIQEGSKSPTTITYYEPSGLIQTITMPTPGMSRASGGVTTSFAYDNLGNLLSITRPGNDTTATITSTLNYTQDGSYSQSAAVGQPLTVTDNLGHTTHYRYDAQGNRATTIDAIGNRTDFRYNIANQQTKTIAPAIGDITNLIGVTRSSLTYVAASKTYNGTLTLTNTGSQPIQGYLLAALTNLAPGVTLANASGTYVNSPALLSNQVSLAAGASTALNVSFTASSANAVYYGVQVYLTDATGNPLAQRSVTQSLYLYSGGPLAATQIYDEAGALFRQISNGYGKEGELLSRSGSTEPVTYTYDAAYRVSTLADGNGNATKYTYNPAGYLASVTYPMGDGQQYPSYDSAGHILKRIDGRGIETDYAYNDPESKLTNVQYANSAAYPNVSQYNVTIDYDGYGRTQDIYDYSGHTHLDYDDLDTQVEIDTTYNDASGHPLPTVSLIYGFNSDGSRHSMNVETAATNYSFTYEYDATGRQQLLTNPFGETTQWSYLNNNWLASQQYANGVLCEYAYNRRGFLNDLTNYSPTVSPRSDFAAMVYDVAANRLTEVGSIPGAPSSYSGRTAYSFDIKNQLTQEQSTLVGGYTEKFNYDAAGNPLLFMGQRHGFNADNQFTDAGFAYDGAGNPTTYADTPFGFDPESNIASLGMALTIGCRADGLRAWKQSKIGTTYYFYDSLLPVCELSESGAVIAMNTYGLTGLLSRHTSASSLSYTFDPRGNIVQRLDGSGAVVSSSLYDGFGVATNTGGPIDPFGFGSQYGYYADVETGMQLLGHRYYDPQEGRFITRDPLQSRNGTLFLLLADRNTNGGRGGSMFHDPFAGTASINLYCFAGNNPINFSDPSGLSSFHDCNLAYTICILGAISSPPPLDVILAALCTLQYINCVCSSQ
jgi:RHS repeat-associated protein